MAGESTIVRSAVGVWLLAVLGAAATAHWVLPDDPQAGLFALGLLCMAYTLAAFGLSRRQAGLTALLPLAWLAGFGMWLPIGQDFGAQTLAPSLGDWGVPSAMVESAAYALVLLAGGVATSAMLYLGTGSASVFWHVLLLTGLVAGASLSHQDTPTTTFAAVIAWHAGAAGSLMRWASHTSWAVRQGVCARCGEDVRGVNGRSCPSCKAALLFMPPPRLAAPGTGPHQRHDDRAA
ncbi:hypothetical protein AY599_16420 [Leptolyngbya valderiana BDU 20041]|nr:hypothetical protein AY599_16420 [Leptolyngbya valderiana BDU 20041]